MIQVKQFDTAENAFLALNIGKMLDKRHATKVCRAIEKALNNGAHTKYATGNDYTIIFKNRPYHQVMPFNKSIKIAQVNNSKNIILFADQYEQSKNRLNTLRDTLRAEGINIEPFIYNYPGLEYKNLYPFDFKNFKMISAGYNGIYRGDLIGFVVVVE